jgi:hypothetical protein
MIATHCRYCARPLASASSRVRTKFFCDDQCRSAFHSARRTEIARRGELIAGLTDEEIEAMINYAKESER